MEILCRILAGVGVVFLFSLAVFIHELGHFLAARWLGFQVDVFSIGFGPALWKKKINGVEYRFSSIPFGGYVALPQLDPSGMEKIQGSAESEKDQKEKDEKEAEKEQVRNLPDVAPWRRIVVAFAGPFGNVVLAVILALLIWGLPGAKTGVVDTTIGLVTETSDAWKKGLRAGDQIISVNDTAVKTWSDLQTEFLLSGTSNQAKVQVLQKVDGKIREMVLPLSTNNVFGIAILEGVHPGTFCVVNEVVPGSPADQAGILPQDIILAVNGHQINNSVQFIKAVVKLGAEKNFAVKIRRAGEIKTIPLTAKFNEKEKRPLIGVKIQSSFDSVKPWMMYKDPWEQLKWDSCSVWRVLQGLISPKAKGERAAIAKNVGGPVAIMVGLYRTVRGSWWDAWGFLRMICINLAILNLLPLPVLDGGHIVFALYEMITRRKPHPKVVMILVNIFAYLLLGLMAILIYRDVARQFTIRSVEKQVEAAEKK